MLDTVRDYYNTHKDCRWCKFGKEGWSNWYCTVKHKDITPFLHKFCKLYIPDDPMDVLKLFNVD